MHDLAAAETGDAVPRGRETALRSGLRKPATGAPTYSVPEAAALLSVSREHLYRLIRIGAFPALRMGCVQHGRYVVSARTVEALLEAVPSTADVPLKLTPDPSSAPGARQGGGR